MTDDLSDGAIWLSATLTVAQHRTASGRSNDLRVLPPSLAELARVALTLYAASGRSAAEIATAFLVPLPTMAQRLSRAKRQPRERGIRFEVPPPDEYADRLPAVLAVLYPAAAPGSSATGRRSRAG